MYSVVRTALPRSSFVAQRALFSSSTLVSQGSATKPLDSRERAAEEAYSRDRENEKLKALKKSIEASKKHLEQLEKDHAELESSQKK
ncbi:BZ3500_MvSof-1268-A1-R1_Chr12-2g03732 [Microbotryum saponariae]|uniref:ATPase inhibitor, mitochondrial n=1 Tax=Microbotryum saponariae TaxID=289078 RepID=A0A2X0LJE4_9BASI|nr:BZ3500_MvSof-1268-A1-R1_Chr12-2g03732 [Microbotryum saponariae]SDA05320.1 BZ3501_MvSof-1269-A2-R1_Chr12-1g03304 [Microbotryum saponariae]